MHEAYNDWMELFNSEINDVWKSERTELRRIAMLLHAIKLEFNKAENNINLKMIQLQDKCNILDQQTYFKSGSTEHCESIKFSSENDLKLSSDLDSSPKLNKMKNFHVKRAPLSPSLLDSAKENKAESITAAKTRNRNVFSPLLVDSSPEGMITQNRKIFQFPIKSNALEHVDVIDCSIVENTPAKGASIKTRSNSKVKSRCNSQNHTLTQMFSEMPKIEMKKRKSNVLTTSNLQNQFLNDNAQLPYTDDTFLFQNDAEEQQLNIIPTLNFAKDCNRVTQPRSKSSQHAYKTAPVRKKSERMKLPGWSCADCEKFYNGLNLSPKKLQEKINCCSKHRNKFPVLNETPKGFWDITMKTTQEPPDEDSHVFFKL